MAGGRTGISNRICYSASIITDRGLCTVLCTGSIVIENIVGEAVAGHSKGIGSNRFLVGISFRSSSGNGCGASAFNGYFASCLIHSSYGRIAAGVGDCTVYRSLSQLVGESAVIDVFFYSIILIGD